MRSLPRQQFDDLNIQGDAQQLFAKHGLQSTPVDRRRGLDRSGLWCIPIRIVGRWLAKAAHVRRAGGRWRGGCPCRGLHIDAGHNKTMRRRRKTRQHVGQVLAETPECHFVRHENGKIIRRRRPIEIIRLRSACILLRNPDAANAIQRIDFGRIKDFTEHLHFTKLLGQRNQAARGNFTNVLTASNEKLY